MGRCNFSLSGIKILVVDDEPLAREAMQELLSFLRSTSSNRLRRDGWLGSGTEA